VPATEVAFWRAALCSPLFIAHAARTRALRVRPRDVPALAGFALVGVTLFYASLNLAIDAGGVSLAFVLLYTAPAFVALLAAALLGERLTRAKGALVALSVVGVALVSLAGGEGVRPTGAAVAWGLTSGLAYSSYYLFGKWVLRRYPPVTVFAYVMVRFEALSAGAGAWLDLALMAVLSTYLAYFVYYTGLRGVEASRAVLVATLEPVLAAALAAALFGERLGALGVAGGVLVLVAAALASMGGTPRPAGRTAAAD
jgi:DME family drug/metabolite transporter